MTIAIVTGRVDAKTTISILNAKRLCAEHRTSDARPCIRLHKNRLQPDFVCGIKNLLLMF